MNESRSEPLYDVFEWMLSLRWLLAALLTVGFFGTWWIWVNRPTPTTTYTLTLQIYPGGSWVRSAEDIAAILRMHLESPEVALLSAGSANPVVVSASSRKLVDDAAMAAEALSVELIKEATDFYQELDVLYSSTPTVAAQQESLRAELFLGGVERSLIDLIRPVVGNSTQQKSVLPYLLVPPLVAALAFLLIGAILTFVKRWRRYRGGFSKT